MRAALALGIEEGLSIEDVEPIEPGPRDVVVRVTASGVCHTDLWVAGEAHDHPVILGHESTGVVEAVGHDVSRVRVGDRVVSTFVPSCGGCWWCNHDESHLCAALGEVTSVFRARRSNGSLATPLLGVGGFAELMTLDERSVIPVETDLPDEHLALLGCGVTTGVNAALNTAAVQPGSSVVVIGCGGVGQAAIQGARIAGATRIIAIDPIASKRALGLRLGATDAIDPFEGDVAAQVADLTEGRGADYAFEVIGNGDTVRQALALTRAGGTAVLIGVLPAGAEVTLPYSTFVPHAKRVIGCVMGSSQVRRDIPRLISLAESGSLQLGELVSRRIDLTEVGSAFEAMESGDVIRSVIVGAGARP